MLVPMEQRRRRQQRSRERKEAAAPLEVGAADRRLDALIEEEMKAKAARAQSVPVGAAEVKRLGVAAGVGGGHGGHSAATASSGQGPPEVRQLLNDPRGQVMGLGHLQEAVRQSFEVLQHALQRPGSQPTLLDPLLRPGDQGGHAGTGCGVLPGHGLAAGTPLRQSGVEMERMGTSPYMAGAGRDDLHPRVLEPYPTTPVGPLGTVNPFSSASVQQAAKGESHVRESEVARGQHPAPSPGLGHVERLRERILREAEETFAREVKKMTDAGDSASFTSVPSAKAEGPQEPVGDPTKLGGAPDTPPGLAPVHDLRGHGSGLNGAANVTKPLDSVTAALPEAMRNLELPQLPSPSTENAALLFGDWLTVITPLMGDLSTSSREFWDWVQREVEVKYNEVEGNTIGTVEDQGGGAGVPTVPTTGSAGEFNFAGSASGTGEEGHCCKSKGGYSGDLLQALHHLPTWWKCREGQFVAQPDGGEVRQLHPGYIIGAIRTWRRWICRAEELHVAIPDSMVLIQALSKVNLTKHGGSQVGFRIAAARQELEVDRRPTLTTTKEFAEFLQAEPEDLALTMPHPSSSKTTSSGAVLQPVAGAQPTIKALGGGVGLGEGQSKTKRACRYWGTTAGCKRGESCTFAHSWEGINKSDRCFHCSGENHFAKDCPYGRERPGKDGKKTAKLKGSGKGSVEKEESGPGDPVKPGATSSMSSTSMSIRPTSSGGEKGQEGGAEPEKKGDPASELITEATSLLKSLRSMKTFRLKQINVAGCDEGQELALLDGGATHPLRMARQEERGRLQPVTVELAHGCTTLYRHPDFDTLLSLEPVEPILPLSLLVENGYAIHWAGQGCTIMHQQLGAVKCWLRSGCPVMNRRDAMLMLAEFEENQKNRKAVPSGLELVAQHYAGRARGCAGDDGWVFK